MPRHVWTYTWIVLFLSLTGATPASGDGFSSEPSFRFLVDRFTSTENEDFTQGAAGDFNRDGMPDLVFVRGGKVRLSLGCALFGATMRVTDDQQNEVDSVDVEALPDPALGGGDWFITAGSAGLIAWQRDSDELVFLSRSLAQTGWSGALALDVADVDSNGEFDIVGLTNDGLTVRILYSALSPVPWEDSFALPMAVDEVLAFQADGAGSLEVAARNASGLGVFTSTGDLLYGHETTTPCTGLAAISSPNNAAQLLAIVLGGSYVVVDDYGVTQSALYLGNIDVAGTAAADLNGDGYTDLVLSQVGDESLLYLANTADSNHFLMTGSSYAWLEYGNESSSTDLKAVPALADFDSDGTRDIAIGGQSTESIEVFLNSSLMLNGDRPDLAVSCVFYGDNLTDGYFFTPIHDPPAGAPAGASLEVAVYLQPSQQDPVNPRPFQSTIYTPTSGGHPHFIKRPLSEIGGSAIYWVMARYVDTTTNQGYPHVLVGFTTHILGSPPQNNNRDYLAQLAGGTSALTTVYEPETKIMCSVDYSGVPGISDWSRILAKSSDAPLDVGTITPLPNLPKVPELPDPSTKP